MTQRETEIIAEREETWKRMDELILSGEGWSEAEYDALSERADALTAESERIRTHASSPQGKTLAQKLKAARARIAELEVAPAGEAGNDILTRTTELTRERDRLARLESSERFAGFDAEGLAKEKQDQRIKEEELTDKIDHLPEASARRARAEQERTDARMAVFRIDTEEANRTFAADAARSLTEWSRKVAERELTDEAKAQWAKELSEVRHAVKLGNAHPWELLKAQQGEFAPIPQELIDERAAEVAQRPVASALQPD
jgi:hypothetical protein